METASAGVCPDAEEQVSAESIAWADLICVMEKSHRAKLTARFSAALKQKRIVCLNIPDRYEYNDPELIRLLRQKVRPLLP